MKLGGVIGGWLVVACFAACASTVSQDRSTGPDGNITGALPLALVEGHGKVRGIVTYPGGDRVDWKVIELPATQSGTLALEMSWTTPRPGLKLNFDVVDELNVSVSGLGVSHGSTALRRSTTIHGATRKYYVRIYAPRRMDAGAYTLHATFTEHYKCILGESPGLEIDEPPPLPAVPSDEP